MADGCDKRRLLDDEMTRFEAEILGSPPGSSEDSSNTQKRSVENRSDDRPPASSKPSVEAAAPLPPPPRPPALGRSPAPLRPPPPPPNIGPGAPHQHGSNFRPHDQMGPGPRPHFNGQRPFGPGPMGPPRPHGPPHRPFHPNGGPPDSYGPNGPQPYGPGSPQQYSNGPGPYRPLRPDGPYGPHRPSDFNMQTNNGPYMNRDHSGGPMRPPGPHRGPPIGPPPPPPTFLPPQLLRPPSLRPPPPPPPVHLMRAPLSSTTAPPTTASLLPTGPPPSAPRIVYASQPTLFTEIVKPAEPAPALPPPAATDANKNKDTPSNKEPGRKNKKQKTSTNGSNLVQQVTTTVSIVKKSSAPAKQPPPEVPAAPAPVVQQQQPPQGPRLKKERRPKKNLRYAGGTVWEDTTLNEWDPDDYRMFAGDLGNDVTDELLTRTFNCYPSFVKAKVVRDKYTNKSKGYGFLSFREPDDYTRAMKEMNGRYVGSRPIKLRKSQWRDRNLDVIQKKNAEKQLLGLK